MSIAESRLGGELDDLLVVSMDQAVADLAAGCGTNCVISGAADVVACARDCIVEGTDMAVSSECSTCRAVSTT